jgi:hypothetical protein
MIGASIDGFLCEVDAVSHRTGLGDAVFATPRPAWVGSVSAGRTWESCKGGILRGADRGGRGVFVDASGHVVEQAPRLPRHAQRWPDA